MVDTIYLLNALYYGKTEYLKYRFKICPRKQFTTLDTHDGIGVVDVNNTFIIIVIERTKMDRIFKIEKDYLYIPVNSEKEYKYLNIFLKDKQVFEFRVCEGTRDKNIFYARLDVAEFVGEELILCGDFSEEFFRDITDNEPDEVSELRPRVHFATERGWINDPNGLVYDGEKYHLYFQHNPFDIKWNNMSWGHAVSTDLLQWEELGDALYPDEDGTVFSGSGINVGGRLFFYYTAAGGDTPWSQGKGFVQKLAISDDGGRTLKVQREPVIGEIGKESRDPKVFWHEETKAYIMVLYLEKNDFAIFKSENLNDFTMTQKITIEEAWECPNLLNIPVYAGNEVSEYKWVFTCADGFYYWGDFDGYEFTSDFVKQDSYLNESFYAAQTYEGIEDRSVNVLWMRIPNGGERYTGLMGIPRELTAVKRDGKYLLVQRPVREFLNRLKKTKVIDGNDVYMVDIDLSVCNTNKCTIDVNGSCIIIDMNSITIDEKEYSMEENIYKLSLIVDCDIVEMGINNDIIVGAFRANNTRSILGCKVPNGAYVEKYVFE